MPLFEVSAITWHDCFLTSRMIQLHTVFIVTVILESAYLDVGYPKLSPMSLYPIDDMLDVFR